MTKAQRKLKRSADGAFVAGICAGVARRLDIDPALVRIAAVVLTIATGGLAVVAYGLLWVVLPVAPKSGKEARLPGRGTGRNSWLIGAGVGLITLATLFIFREVGLWWSDALVWPIVLATAGAALLWRAVLGPGRSRVRSHGSRRKTEVWQASPASGAGDARQTGFALAIWVLSRHIWHCAGGRWRGALPLHKRSLRRCR
ncbi:MAG: PspC domain-containing protein [Solirubrobacterales bacterium]|nr:PspC domain-containing protein [Solirubrobacterales bacterium]